MIIPSNDYLTCRILEIETEKLFMFWSKFYFPFRGWKIKKLWKHSVQKIKRIFYIFSLFSKFIKFSFQIYNLSECAETKRSKWVSCYQYVTGTWKYLELLFRFPVPDSSMFLNISLIHFLENTWYPISIWEVPMYWESSQLSTSPRSCDILTVRYPNRYPAEKCLSIGCCELSAFSRDKVKERIVFRKHTPYFVVILYYTIDLYILTKMLQSNLVFTEYSDWKFSSPSWIICCHHQYIRHVNNKTNIKSKLKIRATIIIYTEQIL